MGQPDRPRGGRPRGTTRERILDIALELFNDQGYDKTSLREIAQRLGVTKAALYYHFERKEDILLELHMRLHELGLTMFERIADAENSQDTAEIWPELLDHFIDQMMNNRALFVLHERNRTAFEALESSERHTETHQDLEHQLRHFLSNPSIPLAQRVRMACSLGAVLSTMIGGGEAFGDVPGSELARLVREAMRDLMGPTAPAARAPAARARTARSRA